MKCQFCNKENSDDIPLTDSETQQEILICQECDELRFFDVPKKIKEIKGYKELTIQELEKKIDKIIDCQIEDLQLKRKGIEI